jgi:ABC-type oligopeptide transport system substrate-binding subunit
VLLRYALNMAMDKNAIVKSLETGSSPALGCIPAMKGYAQLTTLPVVVDGISVDVLRYDPRAARAMLSKAGFPGGLDVSGKRLSVELTFEGNRAVVEIIQQQWRAELNIDVKLVRRDFITLIRELLDLSYRGGCDDVWTAKYPDPATFLDLFQTGSVQSGTGWSDPKFDALLSAADAAPNLETRMQRLAECERFLLTAMPIIPTYFQVYSSLVKPYVRGWAYNPLNEHHFKYVWIDRNWTPS